MHDVARSFPNLLASSCAIAAEELHDSSPTTHAAKSVPTSTLDIESKTSAVELSSSFSCHRCSNEARIPVPRERNVSRIRIVKVL